MSGDLQRSWRDRWRLDPDTAFCNHGSFGACPVAVLEAQRRLRDEMEADPVLFLGRDREARIDAARRRLAGFVGAPSEGVVFVRNATTAVNAVLGSIGLGPGDEILVTDHGYEACRMAAVRAAAAAGAAVRVARIPVPVGSAADVVAAVAGAATTRTRVAVVDHVTSPSALVFPVAEIAEALSGLGVEVLVDGAHGPGQVEVEVEGIGGAAYAGNCHKWLCAPKGAGFLWVREGLRERIRPPVTSHGEGLRRPGRSQFHDRFDWSGTDDITSFLAVPAAIDHVASLLEGGWPAVRERNRRLALAGRSLLAGLGLEPVGPAEMTGSMAAVLLPGTVDAETAVAESRRLGTLLYDGHRVQVPVTVLHGSGRLMLRLSAHLHTSLDDLERLAAALQTLL